MRGMIVRNSLKLAALLLLCATAACSNEPAGGTVAPESASPRSAACVETKKIVDEAEEALKQAMMAGSDQAKTKAEIAEHAAKLKTIAPNDAELGPLLAKQAEEMVWAFDFITSSDLEAAASKAPAGDSGSAYDAIFDLCVSHWKPDLSAADRAIVNDACKKIGDALAKDSAKAEELLAKIKAGTLIGSAALIAQQDLAATWERISDAYDEVSTDLAGKDSINEFLRAVNSLRGAYFTASALVTELDGVAGAEKAFTSDRAVQGHRTVDLYCG